MSVYTIQNQYLKVGVSTKGAELQQIFNIQNGLHYLWGGDVNFWGKKSPVLFPIVGGLKNNQYQFGGKTYSLSRHGFARDMEFKLVGQTENKLSFSLKHTEETLKVYPFEFELIMVYALEENSLRCTYEVINLSHKENLYYSIGAHPAFHVPLLCTTKYEDWYLDFEKEENAPIYPLSSEGLLLTNPIPFLQGTKTLPLKKELFYGDALVFKNLKSKSIKLASMVSEHGLIFSFSNFPFLGIWAAKDAPFVCLEPWCGIADSVNVSGELQEKEGIIKLAPLNTMEEYWQVEVF